MIRKKRIVSLTVVSVSMPLISQCKDCEKLIPYGTTRCFECKDKYKKEKAVDVRYYDLYQRKNVEVYHDKRWVKLTADSKNKYHGLDVYQLFVNQKIVYGILSHHVEAVEDNYDRRFDLSNLIWLSDESHKYIHSLMDRSERDKEEIQKILFNLIGKWMEEYGR